MPKMKTRKSLAKRFWVTPSGKVHHRRAGQDHFNTRESGVTTRRKRRHETYSPGHAANVKRLINT